MTFPIAIVPNDPSPADPGTSGRHSARDRHPHFDQATLVQNARRAREGAFEELWRAHARKVLSTTYRITRNREDAEDALQDSFLNAFLHIKDFDGRSSFSTWLTRIAINSALMILRKRRTSIEVALDDSGKDFADGNIPQFTTVTDANPTPEASVVEREREVLVREAVGALRPSIRRALGLHKLQELSINETAEMTGLTLTAAKSRLHQAKAQLRKSLRPERFREVCGSGRSQLRPAA